MNRALAIDWLNNRKMPSRDELKAVLEFTGKLFDRVCNILDINESKVKR